MIKEKDLSGNKLFEVVEGLLNDPLKLQVMEENSAKIGNINAAAYIVDACIKLMARKN